jgi:hypothetical protein
LPALGDQQIRAAGAAKVRNRAVSTFTLPHESGLYDLLAEEIDRRRRLM